MKLTKLTESDDIEAYLTMFERMMWAYSVPNSRWAFKLAPQLLGRAQKAYVAMESGEATDYALWKVAILRRYDINCDTYHQRFQNTTKTPEETYRELATRTLDLARKWAKESATREELLELVATEHTARRCAYLGAGEQHQ